MSLIPAWKFKYIVNPAYTACVCLLWAAFVTAAPAVNDANPPEVDPALSPLSTNSAAVHQSEISELKRQLAEQQKQIEGLQRTLQKLSGLGADSRTNAVTTTRPTSSVGSNISGPVASMAPMLPSAATPAGQSATSTPASSSKSQEPAPKSDLPAWVKTFKPIGTFYLSYQAGTQDSGVRQTTNYNSFQLKRGYFGAEVDVTPYLAARFVGDLTLDSTGDFKVRAKYLYGKFHAKGNNFITQPYMEFGLAHMPWLDFEEAMNGFRMQDTMLTERNNVFNSADVGVLVGSDLGGSMSSDYKSNVSSKYAGRYGSWQVGVYNGGGYHAAEQNTNKVVEARLTIRPIPSGIPGFQLTVFGLVGKGNKPAASTSQPPDWKSGIAMISYESKYFLFMGQGYLGIGNQGGSALDSNGTAAHQSGFSAFASVRIPISHYGQKVSIIGRVDEFNPNTRIYADLQRRYITGLAWHLYKENIILIDYQRTTHSLSTLSAEDRVQATLQTVF